MTTWPDLDQYPELELFTAGIGGGIFTRGQTGQLYLDGPVVAAYLGDLLIWDGTVSAFVSAPRAIATAQASAPLVQSQVPAIEMPTATATAEALPPTITVGSIVVVPVASATAAAYPPAVSVDATITVPVATASAQAISPLSDATVVVPVATATAQAHVPNVSTTGSSNIGVPVATATTSAYVPAVTVSATIAVPVATASGAALVPSISGSATVTPPAATATAAAYAPTATVVTFTPSGMTKNGTQTWATGGTSSWTTITTWTANTGTYPGSSITSNRLVVQGSKTNATLTANAAFTGGTFSRAHRIRLVDQSGTQIGSVGATVSADSGTCTCTVTGVNLATITSVGVEMAGTDAWCGTLSSGSGTFLTIT